MRYLNHEMVRAVLNERQTIKYRTVDSRYYVDRLLRYIGYYIGNSKHQTISYISLYKLFPLLRCPKMPNPGIRM